MKLLAMQMACVLILLISAAMVTTTGAAESSLAQPAMAEAPAAQTKTMDRIRVFVIYELVKQWRDSPNLLFREWGYAWDRAAQGTFRFDTVALMLADLVEDANRYAREKYGRALTAVPVGALSVARCMVTCGGGGVPGNLQIARAGVIAPAWPVLINPERGRHLDYGFFQGSGFFRFPTNSNVIGSGLRGGQDCRCDHTSGHHAHDREPLCFHDFHTLSLLRAGGVPKIECPEHHAVIQSWLGIERRSRLVSLRRRFDSKRRCCAARVGLVARRVVGG